MMLINSCCLCKTGETSVEQWGDMKLARCACGLAYQIVELTPAEYVETFRDHYHDTGRAHWRENECYQNRYNHDFRIAALRWKKYRRFWNGIPPARSLDVGAASGAFVDYLADIGIDAYGIDPDPVPPARRVMQGTIADVNGTFDLVTYHDVLEHVIDPIGEIHGAKRVLNKNGLLIVDVPDISVPAGHHHVKAEHVWYFTLESLCTLLRRTGLKAMSANKPIPGKLVVCAR